MNRSEHIGTSRHAGGRYTAHAMGSDPSTFEARPAARAAPAPGALVAGYRIAHRLGGGGMGAVYAAEEPNLGKRVAIKVLRRELAADDDAVARFEREARVA